MAFQFRLEHKEGTPAGPPTLKAAVPDWRPGNTIALGHGRMFRVVGTRVEEGSEGDPVSVLVVEETWPKEPLAKLSRIGWDRTARRTYREVGAGTSRTPSSLFAPTDPSSSRRAPGGVGHSPDRPMPYRQGPSVSPCARCAGTACSETAMVTNGFVSDPV
jgi:hypothetical protein